MKLLSLFNTSSLLASTLAAPTPRFWNPSKTDSLSNVETYPYWNQRHHYARSLPTEQPNTAAIITSTGTTTTTTTPLQNPFQHCHSSKAAGYIYFRASPSSKTIFYLSTAWRTRYPSQLRAALLAKGLYPLEPTQPLPGSSSDEKRPVCGWIEAGVARPEPIPRGSVGYLRGVAGDGPLSAEEVNVVLMGLIVLLETYPIVEVVLVVVACIAGVLGVGFVARAQWIAVGRRQSDEMWAAEEAAAAECGDEMQ